LRKVTKEEVFFGKDLKPYTNKKGSIVGNLEKSIGFIIFVIAKPH
jgi:hypothetical protein